MDFELKWQGHTLNLHRKTLVMGVLNVTPDSFSDGGLFLDPGRAVEHGLEMARDGAHIIDVGGESTRPYAEKLSSTEEIDRVIPVIQALTRELSIPISIDTIKSQVAMEAMDAGASIINDISALHFDPEMGAFAAKAEVPIILMHMKGNPENMQDNPVYDDVVGEVLDFLKHSMDRYIALGIRKDLIVVDPGIGFGKTFSHNLEILRSLDRFRALERPILVGSSNKAFIGHILGRKPHERDTGSMAAAAASVMNGAHIIRVHNVKKAVETVKIIDAIKYG